ncbi:MAG: dihydroorotate dehydrogenase [Alphaproteobacteria bacterium PA4]|nr:MAG: dihydroorotate dehydrogenase [Alphaproteobacteria bacterium PA4]
MTPIVKLLRADEWAAFQASGVFHGSPDDRRDGYIHISAPDQVAATAAKWFADAPGLMALTLDADALGVALRWEPARGGVLFPHLYRPLRLDEVVSATAFKP